MTVELASTALEQDHGGSSGDIERHRRVVWGRDAVAGHPRSRTYLTDYTALAAGHRHATGWPTGVPTLDHRFFGDFLAGCLVILVARQSK